MAGKEERKRQRVLANNIFCGFELKKSMVICLLSLMFKLLFLGKSDDPDV